MSMNYAERKYEIVRGRPRPVVNCGKSMTRQSFKDQVNINTILAKYRKSGMIEHLNRVSPFYGDVSELQGYQESLAVVQRADELFGALSSDVRARFGNDPSRMVDFLRDSRNFDEAVKMGLIVKRPEKAPEAPKAPDGAVGTPK